MEALIQRQKTELRQLQDERDALQAEYEKIKKDNQGMKDTLDKDPTKKQANARILCVTEFVCHGLYYLSSLIFCLELSVDIDDILAKLRYVNEMRRILQQIPNVPNVPAVVAQ